MAKNLMLHEGYSVMPPVDETGGARYDWVDEDTPKLDPLQPHSINCKCPDCGMADE